MKRTILLIVLSGWPAAAVQADLFIWGGAGSQEAPVWWNTPDPTLPELWDAARVPNTDGTDSVIIPGGGLRRSTTTVDNGSFLELRGGYYWTGGCDAGRNSPGGRITIVRGLFDAQWFSAFAGSTAEILGGQVNVRGGGEPIPDRGEDAFIDFAGSGGMLTAPNKSQAYLELVILDGRIRIDGVKLTSVDQEVNGKHFELDGTTLRLVDLGVAHDPSLADEQEDVPLDVTLRWQTARDVADTSQVNAAVKRHFVWISGGDPDDPNLVLAATIPAGSPPAETAEYAPGGLRRDGVYYWRIEEGVGDFPAGDPNNLAGPVWMFKTVLSVPIVAADQPGDLLVGPGEPAEFTVEATNPFTGDATGLAYAWYKEGQTDPIGDGPTLTLPAVQEADEGQYYCVVTIIDNGATTESRRATLTPKKLLVHWPLDGDATDTTGNGWDGTVNGDVTWEAGIDGQAAVFDGAGDSIVYTLPAEQTIPEFTVTCWVKAGAIPQANYTGTFNNNSSSSDFQLDMNGSGTYLYRGSSTVQIGPMSTDWVHLAAACDGSQTELYYNGEHVGTVNAADNNFGQVAIGVNRGGTIFFNGSIDDLRVYNYALDPFEIAELYTALSGTVVCPVSPEGDLNGDCAVTLEDVALLAAAWMESNWVTAETP